MVERFTEEGTVSEAVVDEEEEDDWNTFITSILRTNGMTVSIESEPMRPEKKSSTRIGARSHLRKNHFVC